jgi:hypothetical protein
MCPENKDNSIESQMERYQGKIQVFEEQQKSFMTQYDNLARDYDKLLIEN